MKVYSRKTTILYSTAIICFWFAFLFSALCMQILPVPYEIASSVLIILGLSLTLHGVFGSYLAYKHRIPIDLALTTLCCIPLLLLCWGAPAQHKGLPLTLAVLVNIVPSIWYTNSNTRERSGTFR